MPNQTLGVLGRAALPGRVRVPEIDRYAGREGDVLVTGHFLPLIQGHRPAQVLRQRLHGSDRVCDVCSPSEWSGIRTPRSARRASRLRISLPLRRGQGVHCQWPGTAVLIWGGRSAIVTISLDLLKRGPSGCRGRRNASRAQATVDRLQVHRIVRERFALGASQVVAPTVQAAARDTM